MNETEIRIVIDSRLRQAGWRLPGDKAPNVRAGQRISGERNLEADYVLEDDRRFPLAVLEAKRSEIGALAGKEQAREYAKSLKAPFVILSNGKEHYFWDIARHEPLLIKTLPKLDELKERCDISSTAKDFNSQTINDNYILDAQGKNCPPHKRRKLRDYQIHAVQAVQNAAAAGGRAFLLEMATGTGKTLVSAASIKLFLATGHARRVLFIVDRLELEEQARQNFNLYFGNSWQTVVYKNNRDDWNRAEVLISTVQTLAAGNCYKRFSPLDFDLLIVDEAHRAISGHSARAVFDYFCAYKLGLTATPKNYMSSETKSGISPKEQEARKLRDTYHTFGCPNDVPTFRYDLEQGVAENNLIMPQTIDARTNVTTEMFAERGFYFFASDDDNIDEDNNNKKEKGPYWRPDFERKFFSEATNRVICRTIIENAMCDPLSKDVGKSIVYCVSQRHAEKVTAILNQLAAEIFPGIYQSDFAQQVTSNVQDAQEYARRFAANNLGGKTLSLEGYDSAKTRICVTVGMMTTGYDCPDILNICMLRPIFSPSEFIQIRGRGTRPHKFQYDGGGSDIREVDKNTFKLFDFFANCEYFETTNYDEQLSLTSGVESGGNDNKGESKPPEEDPDAAIYKGKDEILRILTMEFAEGMRIDNARNASAEQKLLKDEELRQAVKENRLDDAKSLCDKNHPKEIIDFLQGQATQHSRLTHRLVNVGEVLMLIFDEITELKNREEMMDEETEKFLTELASDDSEMTTAVAEIFKACIDDKKVMEIIENGTFADLAHNPVLSPETCGEVTREIHLSIVEYIKTKIDMDIYTQIAA